VALPKLVLCSVCACCTGWSGPNIRACVCGAGGGGADIRTDRPSVSFYEWLHTGSYFPAASKSATAILSVPFPYHLERLDLQPISHFFG